VLHLNPAGAVTHVQLLAEDLGLEISVEISHQHRERLALSPRETVSVSPRRAHVFVPEPTAAVQEDVACVVSLYLPAPANQRDRGVPPPIYRFARSR
jgi:hypothetical protein